MKESIGLKYRLSEDETSYIVTGIGTCTDTKVIIPSMYNGKPVTAIGIKAFAESDNLTRVVMPSNVKCIYRSAFAFCDNLESIEIPEGVTRIQYGTFLKCTSLGSITIPRGVTTIIRRSFVGCSNLKTITIPASLTHIDMQVFVGCDNLTNVYYEGTEEQWKEILIREGNGCLTNAHVVYNVDYDDIFELDDLSDDDFELDGLFDIDDDDDTDLDSLFDDEDDEDLDEPDSVSYEMVRSWKDEIERLKQPVALEDYTDSIIEKPVTIAKMRLEENRLEITFSQKVNSIWIEIFHKVYADVCDELEKFAKEYEGMTFEKMTLDLLDIFKCLHIDEYGIDVEVNDKAFAHPNIELIIKQVVTAVQRILENIPKFYDAVLKERTVREHAAKIEELEAKIQQALTVKAVKIKNINDMLDDMLVATQKMSLTIEDLYNDYGLAFRPYNCLKRAGISTVAELTEMTRLDLRKLRNMGLGGVDAIEAILESLGLSLKSED